MIDFKPIEEFTFDDCVRSLDRYRSEGVPIDAELQNRYEYLLSELHMKDNEKYKDCTSISQLHSYISSFPLSSDSTHYQPLHVKEAKGRINKIMSDSRKRRKKTMLSILLFFSLIILLIIVGYQSNDIWSDIDRVNFGMKGGEANITIYANSPVELDAISDSFFSFDCISRNSQEIQILIKCRQNASYIREGILRVTYFSTIWGFNIVRKDLEIPIVQDSGRGSFLNVSQNIELDYTYNDQDLYIDCDGIWTIGKRENPDNWLSAYQTGKGDTLHLYASPNNSCDWRFATLELRTGEICRKISINQRPHPPYVEWGKTTLTIDNSNNYPIRYTVSFKIKYLNPSYDLKLILIIKNWKTNEIMIKEETSLAHQADDQYSAEIGIITHGLPKGDYSAYWKLYSNGNYIKDTYGETEHYTYEGFRHGHK